jgi:hypothetical protein
VKGSYNAKQLLAFSRRILPTRFFICLFFPFRLVNRSYDWLADFPNKRNFSCPVHWNEVFTGWVKIIVIIGDYSYELCYICALFACLLLVVV